MRLDEWLYTYKAAIFFYIYLKLLNVLSNIALLITEPKDVKSKRVFIELILYLTTLIDSTHGLRCRGISESQTSWRLWTAVHCLVELIQKY